MSITQTALTPAPAYFALNPPAGDGTVRRMSGRVLVFVAIAACAVGCAGHARQAPAVKASAPAPRAADHPDILREATDATWGVITTPARIVAGDGKSKSQPPEPTEPPAAVIMPRSTEDGSTSESPQ